MTKEEFNARLFEACKNINCIIINHIAINKNMGIPVSENGWDEQIQKMTIVGEEFYQECRDAFSKVQKFG